MRWKIIAVGAVLLAVVGFVVVFGALDESGDSNGVAAAPAGLPACRELPGRLLGPFSDDRSWGGCVADSGAAARSYRYECTNLRRVLPPDGHEETIADLAPVVFIPDAGLLGARGEEWESKQMRGAWARMPFRNLVPYRCDELRSLPHDDLAIAGCDLDQHVVDFYSTQGCASDGEAHSAVGRVCTFFDFDINVTWEQWWIDAPPEDYGSGPFVMETQQDGMWVFTPPDHRDDRCRTPPDDWPAQWRYTENR